MTPNTPDQTPEAETIATMTSHAKPAPRNHDRAAAWLVLIGAGVTTMSFNIWHALHAGMPPLLAPLEGIAPVLVAMGLSHVVSAYQGGWFMKTATFGIMLAAMGLSLDAAGSVVRPALGPLWWLFGLVVDAAALIALQVILSPESRAAAKAARQASRYATASPVSSATPEAAASPTAGTAEVPSEGSADVPDQVPAESPSRDARPRPKRLSDDPDAKRARTAYRKSAAAGQPLSQRALGEMFGRSKTWGRDRIDEVEDGPRPLAAARESAG